MAWSASVVDVRKTEGAIYVDISYGDGVKSFVKTYRWNGVPKANWIENTAYTQLQELDGLDVTTIAPGPITPIEPDPVDTGKAAFWRKVAKAERVKFLIDIGVVSKTDPKVQTLVASIQADIDTYWGDL